MKPDTRVRAPPPLPRSQGRGVAGNTLGPDPRDCGFESCRPFHRPASRSGVAQRQCARLLTVTMQVRILPPEPFTRSCQHARACSRPQPGRAEFDSRTTLYTRPRRLAARTPDSQSGNEGSIPSGVTTCRVRPAGPGRWPFKPETRVRVPHATSSSSACSSGREERRFGGPEAAGSSPATLTISSGCSSAWLESTRSGTVRARVRISPPRLHLPAGRPMAGHALDRRGISVRVRAGGPREVGVAQRQSTRSWPRGCGFDSRPSPQ